MVLCGIQSKLVAVQLKAQKLESERESQPSNAEAWVGRIQAEGFRQSPAGSDILSPAADSQMTPGRIEQEDDDCLILLFSIICCLDLYGLCIWTFPLADTGESTYLLNLVNTC